MKKLIAVMGMCAALGGCATSHFTAGRDFPSASVASITKGKTTTIELKLLFGEPYAKSAVSETDEKWIYTYTNGSAHAQSYVVTMKVTTTDTQKTHLGQSWFGRAAFTGSVFSQLQHSELRKLRDAFDLQEQELNLLRNS
jgi:hypothetical protein